ncbi:MAG TPA: NAD-dependent epimerase/dehydratase family protein, partial [Candidatus Acidoferrum sp.]|nr:NAD-dependent epimerase/dehydratase family protein [Candidatus Acidoferrum sp.]
MSRSGAAMKILVTGGAGFIGSHVVEAYVKAGHEVWVMDNLSRGHQESVDSRARFVRMDLGSPGLMDLFAEVGFDCVNHHAAQIDVRRSVANPVLDATINILGTVNLLEAVRAHGVPRFIFASTGGAIYGAQRRFPATEEHPAVPLSPYGITKLSVEHYLEYYRQVHGLHYTILRYANVYGPRQDPEGEAGVVAIFCERVLRRQRLTIYGEGNQTRDYVYVGDVARGNLLALEYLTADRRAASCASGGAGRRETALPIFNLGTGIETSVNALAARVLEAANMDSPISYQPRRPGEVERSAIDPSRARVELGWTPAMSLTE